MGRAWFCLLFVAVAAALGTVLDRPARVSACSVVPFMTENMGGAIDASAAVAVGTLEDRQGNVITLVVEEGLKGASAGDRLTINNATNLDCYEALEPGRQNYEQGARVLVFLEPDTHGVADYKVYRFGWDIFEVEGDVLHPYVQQWIETLPHIDDVRRHFETLRSTAFVPGLEGVGPCNPPYGFRPDDTGAAAEMAEVILIGTTAGNRDGGTLVRVDEVFKGDPGAEFVLNDRHMDRSSAEECRPVMGGGRNYLPEGTRVALFLVRDDYGVAEWRPAVWGTAYWRINDLPEDRYEYIPLLSDVRAAAAERVDQSPQPTIVASPNQPVTSQPVPAGGDGWPWWQTAALIPVLLAAAAAIIVVRKRSGRA